MNKSWTRYSDGVVMVEMAIAMVVFSICLGGMLSLMYHMRSAAQATTTQDHVAVVNKALQRFHQLEGYIPCPSSVESYNGEALERCQGAVQQVGLIPYKTLGIPETYVKDGSGFYFTYAVSEHATFKRSAISTTLTESTLNTRGVDGLSFRGGREGFAYLIVSHGPRGAGAFLGARGRGRRATYTDVDRVNSLDTLDFISAVNSKDSEQRLYFVQRADLPSEESSVSYTEGSMGSEGRVDETHVSDPYASWSQE